MKGFGFFWAGLGVAFATAAAGVDNWLTWYITGILIGIHVGRIFAPQRR